MPVAQNSKAPRPYGVEFLSQPRSNFLFGPVGTWLSLVEHSLGVRGVGSSNLPVPTILLSSSRIVIGKNLTAGHKAPQRKVRS